MIPGIPLLKGYTRSYTKLVCIHTITAIRQYRYGSHLMNLSCIQKLHYQCTSAVKSNCTTAVLVLLSSIFSFFFTFKAGACVALSPKTRVYHLGYRIWGRIVVRVKAVPGTTCTRYEYSRSTTSTYVYDASSHHLRSVAHGSSRVIGDCACPRA